VQPFCCWRARAIVAASSLHALVNHLAIHFASVNGVTPSMAWYAYCISEKQAFPELARHRKPVPMQALTGISGNQIFLYPASDLAVIVSEHDPQENLDQQQAARDHARVVGDCFKHSTVLPFRFGTVFADDEALRRSIRSNQRQYATHVERLRGKAEMHLKVLVDDCCIPLPLRAVSSNDRVGKGYLSNLRETASRQRERQTKGRAISVQMQRLFAPLDEEVTCRTTDNGKMLLDVSHLIEAKCVERYQNKFATTRELLKDCKMQLSGPWPPYHFVHRLTRPHTIAPGIPA
jgi:hypothetical protein